MGCALGKSSKVHTKKLKYIPTGIDFNKKREELLIAVFSLYNIKSKCLSDIEHYRIANDKAAVFILKKKERCITENLAVIRMVISKIDDCLLEHNGFSKEQIRDLENYANLTLEKINNNRIFGNEQEDLGKKDYEESITAELLYHGLNLGIIESEILDEIKSSYENPSASVSDSSNTGNYIRKKYFKVRK